MADTTAPSRTVQDYLTRLDGLLHDLPRARRAEIVGDIREHIDSAIGAEPPPVGEAAVRNVLERLGDPADIAEEARQRFGLPRPGINARDWWAPPLLSVGSFLLPLVGWVVGVGLLWSSSAWRRWEKVLATLVWPGGVMFPLFVTAWDNRGDSTCTSTSDGSVHCTTTGELVPVTWSTLADNAGTVLVYAAPFLIAAYLMVRLVRIRRALRA